VKQMAERPRRLMWVRGDQGERGNEEADKMAKMEVWIGTRMQRPKIMVKRARGGEKAHIRDNRLRTTTAIAEGDRENGRP